MHQLIDRSYVITLITTAIIIITPPPCYIILTLSTSSLQHRHPRLVCYGRSAKINKYRRFHTVFNNNIIRITDVSAGHGRLQGIRLSARTVLFAQPADRHRRPGHGQQRRTQVHLGRFPQPRRSREQSRFEFLPPDVRIQISGHQREG